MNGRLRADALGSAARGAAALPAAATALACLVLRDHVPCPPWIAFIPPALAWASIGLAGHSMESLLMSLALSVGLSPLLATGMVLLPAGPHEASMVALIAFRQSIAATIGIMTPLALVSAWIGGAVRGLLDRANPPTWNT